MNEHQILDIIKSQMNHLDDYGQIQIHLKKHHGNFTNADLVTITSIKFTDNEPNVTATSSIFSMIKALQESHETGNLSFSINFKDGKADTMSVQDFKKV